MDLSPTRLIDLSRTISQDMPLFSPKAPRPRISAWLSHDQARKSGAYRDCSCEVTKIEMVTSAGTYLDSPYHFHPEGPAIDRLPLEKLVLPGLVVDCPGARAGRAIGPEVLRGLDLSGRAVLFNTGWSRFWGGPEYFHSPFLAGETAQVLIEGGAGLAGVDFLVIDDTTDPRRPVHVSLLRENILIVENLTGLAALPRTGFLFHAAPVKVKGAAAFPVRAYAMVFDR